MNRIMVVVFIHCVFAFTVSADDWPMVRADAARSGYTAETPPDSLSLQWMYQADHAPCPAWMGGDTRMPFDYAYQTVIADGTLYFGSSADCKIYALDTSNGQERWSYFTKAPVRFAPVIWNDRVFAVSDDGYLYCLSAHDGALIWKRRGGPDDRMILGNDRMISKWPARGGPVIYDDILYFAAGIWPSEGIFLYALDPVTCAVLWLNDESGGMELDQPHGGARAKSGVSAQGDLVATEDRLFMPTGRAVPASFRRSDGAFEYFHLQANRADGGSPVMAAGSVFFNNGVGFNRETGLPQIKNQGKVMVSIPGGIVQYLKNKIAVYEWADAERVDKRGDKFTIQDLKERWSLEAPHECVSLIVAGDRIVSGGDGSVCLIDRNTKSVSSTFKIDGTPYGLAFADGRLFVSTDQGRIYCFGGEAVETPPLIQSQFDNAPYEDNSLYAQAAEAIVQKTGVTEGYCLDLGCGDGALAYELARRTSLKIYAIESDPAKVAIARERLNAAGLYGVRVTVHQTDLKDTDYPDYFADLIVSGRSVETGSIDSAIRLEASRIQRPFGGVICIGKPGSLNVNVKGALEGAGEWTHQYTNPANTGCSADRLARGPLGMLWFRDPDLVMPSRHGRGPAPLFYKGTLFVEGVDALRAVNPYNGRTLWEYPFEGILTAYDQEHLMGTAGTQSNFCAANDSVYIHQKGVCFRLDAASGKKIGAFKTPVCPDGRRGTWGYIACVGDTLFGTVSNEAHVVRWRYGKSAMSTQFTESRMFFALNAKTGELRWKYTPKHSIRHNAIAIGAGRVYLIDRPIAEMDRVDFDKAKNENKVPAHPGGELIALDMESGNIVWRDNQDIYGTMLALSVEHDALLMAYQSTRFQLDSERGGRMTVFRSSTGKRLWDNEEKYASRPLINDRIIYAQPGAWDLLTGERLPFEFSRSYGCGILAGSSNLLVYRSATLGYRDLQKDEETQNYGGIRPGCWINTLPVGGLVLMPHATTRCTCSYLISASIALQALER